VKWRTNPADPWTTFSSTDRAEVKKKRLEWRSLQRQPPGPVGYRGQQESGEDGGHVTEQKLVCMPGDGAIGIDELPKARHEPDPLATVAHSPAPRKKGRKP
jgi:hypothetical protein